MNYGKKGAKKRQSELTSKGVVFRKKLHVTFCKALLVCFFASCNYWRKPWIRCL